MTSSRRHDVAWMLGIAAGTIAFLLLVARPQLHKTRELKESLKTEHRDISQGRNDLQELPRLEAEVDGLQRQVRNFDEQVPARDELGQYLEKLSGVAQDHRLRPDAIEPAAAIASHDLFAVPIVVKVHGPFREVYGMVKDVLAMPRLTQVQRFDAKIVPEHPGEVQAEMQLRVFYRAS